MIYFDKKHIRFMKRIKRSKDKGIRWSILIKKHGDDLANVFLFEALDKEGYVIHQRENGDWVALSDLKGMYRDDYRVFTTPKTNEMLEMRCYNFRKWVVPTIISIAALIVSVLTALLK